MSAGHRRRPLSSSISPESQARYLYEARGAAAQALRVYSTIDDNNDNDDNGTYTDGHANENGTTASSNGMSLSRRHNHALLTYLTADAKKANEQAFLVALKEMYTNKNKKNATSDKGRGDSSDSSGEEDNNDSDSDSGSGSGKVITTMQTLVLAHNLALNSLVANNPMEGRDILLPLFQKFSKESLEISDDANANDDDESDTEEDDDNNDDEINRDRLEDIKCKITFLLIDCILALFHVNHVKECLEWVETIYIVHLKQQAQERQRKEQDVGSMDNGIVLDTIGIGGGHHAPPYSGSTAGKSYLYAAESAIELKFRLHCYKSRFLFIECKTLQQQKHTYDDDGNSNNNGNGQSNQTKVDAKLRLARKELKNAMEIYNHKLSGKNKDLSNNGHASKRGNASANGSHSRMGMDTGTHDGTASIQDSLGDNSKDDHQQQQQQHNHGHHGSSGNIVTVSYPNGTTNATATGAATANYETRTPLEIKKADAQNQHALYLKANLEHLKGNEQKSLKLCSEARKDMAMARKREREQRGGGEDVDGEEDDTLSMPLMNNSSQDEPYQEQQIELESSDIDPTMAMTRTSHTQSAIYNNNIALIHQTSGQAHHAAHYYALALGHLEHAEQENEFEVMSGTGPNMNVAEDGSLRGGNGSQISIPHVLYNASTCALEIGNYHAAYECMSRFMASSLSSSEFFTRDPFSWRLLGESCIGIYSSRKNGQQSASNSGDGSSRRNQHDLNFNPIAKALDCFMACIAYCNKNNEQHQDHLESARVSLAYIWMELNNPAPVIRLADLVLGAPLKQVVSSNDNDGATGGYDNTHEFILLSQRRRVMMRIYACEAMCLLGNPRGGLGYLKGGKKDVELGREVGQMIKVLSSSTGGYGQQQHSKSNVNVNVLVLKASLHLSIAGANAMNGNLMVGKEIAQNCIQSKTSSEITTLSKQTLLYCLLSEGKKV